jgi:hypothetical protein
MELEITPEPTEEERAAIVAALRRDPEASPGWPEEEPEP